MRPPGSGRGTWAATTPVAGPQSVDCSRLLSKGRSFLPFGNESDLGYFRRSQHPWRCERTVLEPIEQVTMPISTDTSFLDNMPANVAVQFFDRVAASPDREAFRFPRGGAWESVSWQQAGDLAEAYAAGLIGLGLQPEQRVGIASGTRYEWILADLAVMCAAGATTTVYPTTNADDTTYILGDSESRVVFAEDDEQVKKLTDNKSELPHVVKVVVFEGKT